MNKKYKVVALIGKSACGKDTVLKNLINKIPSLHRKISTTTRPPREGELAGRDYYFVDESEFANSITNGDMLEATCFNDWFYGTEKKAFLEDKINVGIFNPAGIRALKEDSSIELIVIYVLCTDKVRLIRSLEREKNPNIKEIIRRFEADEIDFRDIDFPFCVIINDGRFSMEELVNQIRQIIIDNL